MFAFADSLEKKDNNITKGKGRSPQVGISLFLWSLQFGPGPWHMLDCNGAHSPEFINQPFAVFSL